MRAYLAGIATPFVFAFVAWRILGAIHDRTCMAPSCVARRRAVIEGRA